MSPTPHDRADERSPSLSYSQDGQVTVRFTFQGADYTLTLPARRADRLLGAADQFASAVAVSA